MVGGPLHGTHQDVDECHGAQTVVAAAPFKINAAFWNQTDPDTRSPDPIQYRRFSFLLPTGWRGRVYASNGHDLPLITEAMHMRGLPGVITALLPSRGRSDGPLQESIASLRETATDPTRLEILVAADDDDDATPRACEQLGVHCIQMKRYGYSALNEYFNRLAELASGEWLMLWNDDARMETAGWDEKLIEAPPETMIADLWVDRHSPDLCTFPVLRRHVLHKAGGVYSPVTCHCDTWWQDIGRRLEILKPVDIRIDHQRSDLKPGMHADQTRSEALSGYRSADFYGVHVQAVMNQYVERIGLALAEERYK
jgi:hypothetical protein